MKPAFFFRRARTSETPSRTGSAVAKPFRFRRSRTDDTAEGTIAAPYSLDEEGINTCLICMEPMTAATDLAHPVLCANCTFNFCGDCMESLMQETKEVHCPNCRSDLSATICDTLLLRMVDHPHNGNNHDANECHFDLRRAMDVDTRLAQEIAAARDREGQFWEKKETASRQRLSGGDSFEEERFVYHEEWGLEVDLRIGAHESIKLPYDQQSAIDNGSRIDTTLLAGLDSAMSAQEQEQVTRYLISGDTAELALAAKLQAGIAEKVRGFQQQRANLYTAAASEPDQIEVTQMKEESLVATVYQLIEAGKKARSRTTGSNQSPGSERKKNPGSREPYNRSNSYTKLSTIKAAQHRLVERQLRAQLAFIKRHPLPARMPKYSEVTVQFDSVSMNAGQIVKSLPFRFCNDTWDGTVMDAFSKIHVTDARPKLPAGKNYSPAPITSTFVDNYEVKHRRPLMDEGVRNILGTDDDVRMDTRHPRVLIASVVDASSSSTTGVMPGDVVTQLNGVELRDETVDDIIARICSLCYSEAVSTDDETSQSTVRLRFLFNADRAVAKALQMRATAVSKMFYEM